MYPQTRDIVGDATDATRGTGDPRNGVEYCRESSWDSLCSLALGMRHFPPYLAFGCSLYYSRF